MNGGRQPGAQVVRGRLLRRLVTGALMIVMIGHALGWWSFAAWHAFDARLDDTRLRASMPHTRAERVVIVDVDERSLAEFGQWPWSRATLARLVEELGERQQVAVLALDVVFAEADHRHDAEDADGALADAMARSPVVLGCYFSSDRDGLRLGALPTPIVGQKPWPGLLGWDGYGGTVAALAQAAPAVGCFNAITDPDGVVRAVPLVAAFEGRLYESLALAALRTGLGQPGMWFEPAWVGVEGTASTVTLLRGPQPLSIPIDERGSARVPFRGPGGPDGGSFRYVSAADVLSGALPAASLQDKFVLFGFSAPGLADLHTTPVGRAYPGVEVHASLISGVLEQRVLRQPHWSGLYEAAWLLVLGAILMIMLPSLGLWGSVLLSGLMVATALSSDALLYFGPGLLLPLASVLSLIAAALVANLALGYLNEGRARRTLMQQFSSYVPPELVRQMLREPARYSMRARTQELTVMFCDLREFTDLAETMPPVELQQLLGKVFSRITRVIRDHHGTIDKYMGDCVMAFWGAPVPDAEHAARAVDAALAIHRELELFNAERLRQGKPGVSAGMGLNTGHMAVGNMGSDVRRAYTVIGDAVNLASRLEGLCLVYGVNMVASQATRDHAQAAGHAWQELDRVRVRGRQQVTVIHTARVTTVDTTAQLHDELRLWHEALALWRADDLDAFGSILEALRRRAPDNALYALYAQRLASRRQAPGSTDWDGVTVLEHG